MNFAVIGSAHGHIHEFIGDMLDLKGNFIGVYEDGSGTARGISDKYGVPLYDDIDELLEQGIVVAGTSAINNEKINIIEKCSEKGVHIIVDKPLVVDHEQYNRLQKVIETGKIQVGLMLTVRFMPEIVTLKRLIEDDVIGRLISVEIFNPHKLIAETRADWVFDDKLSGGIAVDLMVHSVDLYNWLAESEIQDFHGVAQKSIMNEKENFYDSTQFLVTSKNGTSGYFRADWHMTDSHWTWGDFRVFCSGTKGCVEVRALGDPLTREPLIVLYEEGKETCKLDILDYKNSVTKDFVNRVEGKEHVIGHEDILSATKISIEMENYAKRISIK